jgi:Zn-dependent protease
MPEYMKYSLYVGSVAGIKIFLHWTFVILIGWIIVMNLQASLGWMDILWSLTFIFAVFGCVTLHELGHALAAKRYNIKTHNITLLPIGGIARLDYIPEQPKEELFIAIAGPLVNLAIALALYPLVLMYHSIGDLTSVESIKGANFIPVLLSVNLWLALFNLIPAFPMDGGRVFRALLAFKMGNVKATRLAATVGQFLAMVFVFAGFWLNPLLIFIGLFIFLGAQTEATHVEARFILKGHTVKDVLMRDVPTMDNHSSMKEAASRLLNSQNKNFLVLNEGNPFGTITREEIIKAIRNHGGNALVNTASNQHLDYFPLNMPLDQAWTHMQQEKRPMVLVVSDGQLKGAVDEESIEELILIETAQSHN